MWMFGKWLQRLTPVLLACAVGALGAAPALAADVATTGTIIVGTNPTFPPFEMMDGDKVVGFDIDAIRAVAAAEGLKVTLRSMPFDGIVPSLQAGSVDVGASGMTITKERLQNVDFTNPYYRSGLSVLVMKNSPVKGFADLKDRVVATQAATSSVSYLQQHGIPGDHVKQFQNIGGAYSALLTGGVDAVLFDNPTNVAFLTKNASKVKIVGPLLTGEYYGFAVSKKDPGLAQRLDKGLEAIKENGEYKRLFEKYFGGDMSGAVTGRLTAQQAAGTD